MIKKYLFVHSCLVKAQNKFRYMINKLIQVYPDQNVKECHLLLSKTTNVQEQTETMESTFFGVSHLYISVPYYTMKLCSHYYTSVYQYTRVMLEK